MPNWCSTSYVIEGNKKNLKKVCNLINSLVTQPHPTISNDFGSAWLGCFVEALGGKWEDVKCRGILQCAELDGDCLRLCTETAWVPCNEVFDLLCKKFPSFRYYYLAEEPGCGVYLTNDEFGAYFPERVVVDMNSKQTDWVTEYFCDKEDAYEWLSKKFGYKISNQVDIDTLNTRLQGENDDYYCYLEEFTVA